MKKNLAHRLLPHIQAYQNLEYRDRLAVLLLAIFLTALVIFYGLLMPAISYHNKARTAYTTEKELLHWLKSLAPAVESIRNESTNPAQPQSNTLSTVNNSAKQFKLIIKRVQPENSGDLRVWLDTADFNNSLRWLHHLHQIGITAKDLTLEKTAEGQVNLRATFSS